MENQNIQTVFTALKANNLQFVDDHSRDNACDKTASKFAVYHNWKGDQFVCPIWDHTVCCLNPIYVDDTGVPHLSTTSVGGVVHNGDIARFNREQSKGSPHLVTLFEVKF